MFPPTSQTFLSQRSDPGLLVPGRGRSAANFLSHITDQYFIHCMAETGFSRDGTIALAAVGGYGRKELSLKSDIDILILANNISKAEAGDLVSAILHPLWDAGLDVGHGVRNTKDCLDLAVKDFKVMVSLLDVRFICGDREYFQGFHERIMELMKEKSHELSSLLVKSARERVLKKSAENYMEPDLKNDPGGFRDYHLILWLEKLALLSGSLKLPLLEPEQKKSLMESMDFFFDLRNILHSTVKRKNDRLYADLQPEVSAMLGYECSLNSSGTEKLLGDLFERQNFISSLAMEVCERVFISKQQRKDNHAQKVIKPGIAKNQGLLFFAPEADPLTNPVLVSDIFRVMADTGTNISWQALRRIKKLLRDPMIAMILEKSIKKSFPRILASDYPDHCVRGLRQAGLLKLLLPELDKLWFFVQFDGAHTYPLGEHTLHCLKMVASLDERQGFLAEYLGAYKNSLVLRLAALLHDVGKGLNDHSNAGARMAESILKRLDFDQEISDQVIFLIKNHLVMIRTALKRDIDEEEVVAAFAGRVGKVERLNLLTSLSHADSIATGPLVWTPWRENLIRRLYFKSRRLMRHTILAGHHAGHRMAMVRDRIRSHEHYSWFWEGTIQAMPHRYLLKTPVSEIIRHIRLSERFGHIRDMSSKDPKTQDFILLTEKGGEHEPGCWNLTLMTRDRPGLLAAVSAALAMNQIEIYSAGLFTWENGLAVDRFKVSPPLDPLYTGNAWSEVRKDLKDLLTGQKDILRFCDALRKTPAAGSRFRISLDNESSDFYTLIEINSPRHPCLTWQVSLCLAELCLDISYAVISTHMDQSLLVFYIRDHRGQKLFGDQKELIKKIHQTIRMMV